jgi:hypothetical protein
LERKLSEALVPKFGKGAHGHVGWAAPVPSAGTRTSIAAIAHPGDAGRLFLQNKTT